MKAQIKTLFASILLMLITCFGAFAAVSEKHALGDFASTQHYVGQNPEAIQLVSLGIFTSSAENTAECCNATNNAPNLVIDTKIQTQMTNRGWSRQNVDDVIADGPTGRTTDNRRPNKTDDGLGRDDTATVYGSSGNYVVVNDRTGEIVQVSGRNDPSWIDDGRIQWD